MAQIRDVSRVSVRAGLMCGVAAALAALAPTALGGPDITHQSMHSASHYGPVGTVHGYAWGSQTCNLGDAPLAWINGGTPALAMNAYRLENGRLMQIGIGNAKHGCCVANGSGCGTCTAGPAGTLRPGCRDTYSSGFNGGQSRLGNRSGINPYEGTFTAIPGGTGNAIWRRVQIDESEMSLANHPNAIFIGEGLYVCAEEEPAQQLNNATHRVMSVARTGATPTYVWSLADVDKEGTAAIFAWRDHGLGLNQPDTSIVIQTVDVPGEGRYFIGGKATDLGNGTWMYDYAVYNLNSDRAGTTLSVPNPLGSVVTNIGFHSVDYHDDPYDNADWNSGVSNCTVTWASPEKYEDNPNTNALRWGTMYNFWFTSTSAPTTGSASMGLFKPGTPTSVSVGGLPVPGAPTCIADVDDGSGNGTPDGGATVDDLLYYIGIFGTGSGCADVDNGSGTGVRDGGVTIDDLLYYLTRFNAGC
ncbi:MAG: GC-type dockerin domain-anchored protein [Phycisphaerales bacterium]